jgi:hypothetical protein
LGTRPPYCYERVQTRRVANNALVTIGGNLFFYLVSRRYERGSISSPAIRVSVPGARSFGDTMIASAILDRLLHNSITTYIKGESFRLKEKLKADLLRPKLETSSNE